MQLFLQILHYATLPGAMGLLCVLFFMPGERKRGQLLMLSLSAAVSTNLLLKELFKVPRPWWPDVSKAPYLAEGGYALPCLHTQVTTAVLGTIALTSKHKPVRFLCAAGIWITAAVRALTGLQSIPDVLTGAVCGLMIAFLLCWNIAGGLRLGTRDWRLGVGKKDSGFKITECLFLGIGFAAAILLNNGWGLGLYLTVIILNLLDKPFQKAESRRTTFGKLYGTVFAAGIYAGLIIFLPFLIEWLITPLWPGQMLIVFLITLVPCLLRLFPIF